jgi:hypothetical protein
MTALVLVTASVATSALSAAAPVAQVVYVPSNSSPTPPAGLKVTCMDSPTTLTAAPTCPVIQYMGATTWAYSYIDNRVSFALVTYDSTGKIVRNVEMPGARYVWNMVSSYKTHIITISGQSNQTVEANWSDVGP